MKIMSVDRQCWITLELKRDLSGYAGFEIEIHADIGHGQFSAKNLDVQLFSLRQFVSEFDEFILDRSRSPRLEGTYGSCLAFSMIGGAVLLEYGLGDACCGKKTIDFYHSGGFEIEQDSLLELFAGFRQLLAAQLGVPENVPQAAYL